MARSWSTIRWQQGALLLVGLWLAACSGTTRSRQVAAEAAAHPQPAAPAVAQAGGLPAAGSGEGGLTTEEPALAAPAETGTSGDRPALVAAATPLAGAAGQTAKAVDTAPPEPAPLPQAVASAALPAVLPTPSAPVPTPEPGATATPPAGAQAGVSATSFSDGPSPLQVSVMRQQSYPGSAITFERTLTPGANYKRYVVSYLSDGFKIYALLTIPGGPKPATGWPVIIFNHGYIPPAVYRTTERYVAYVDAIARAGYIVFKSDYRGHGSSGGTAEGGYGSPAYTADVLNALASLKAYPDADPARIGMWGHSMGGQVTLRAMVVSHDIKAGVIWGGVVAPYPDIISHWTRRPGAVAEYIPPNQRRWRQELIAKYGTPEQNPAFWASISPNSYLSDLSGPLQLDASVTDEEVPVAFSATLYAELQAAGQTAEFYQYPNDNHNISASFSVAMQRSIAWFDKYVKGE